MILKTIFARCVFMLTCCPDQKKDLMGGGDASLLQSPGNLTPSNYVLTILTIFQLNLLSRQAILEKPRPQHIYQGMSRPDNRIWLEDNSDKEALLSFHVFNCIVSSIQRSSRFFCNITSNPKWSFLQDTIRQRCKYAALTHRGAKSAHGPWAKQVLSDTNSLLFSACTNVGVHLREKRDRKNLDKDI